MWHTIYGADMVGDWSEIDGRSIRDKWFISILNKCIDGGSIRDKWFINILDKCTA